MSPSPDDSKVLDDLAVTQAWGGVRSRVFDWSGGTGYILSEGDKASALIAAAAAEIKKIDDDLEWVVHEFGSRSASDLELVSTIIYVDRDYEASGEKISKSDLATNVHKLSDITTKRRFCSK